MTSVDSASTFSQPKVVEKAFSLPIVSDSYSYGLDKVSSLTSALQPYLSSLPCPHLSSSLASLPPLLSSRLSSLQALAEERLPGMVTAKLYTRDQVIAGVQYLDSTLCSGLDLLVVKVPSLTSPSPALYSSTREAAVSQLTQATTYLATTTTQATTYLASFTLGQLALKVSDCGLETAESLLKLAPASCSSRCEPLVSGLKTVRGKVDRVRREGARINGSQKAMDDMLYGSSGESPNSGETSEDKTVIQDMITTLQTVKTGGQAMERRACMTQLIRMARSGTTCGLSEHFRTVLRVLLENLEDSEGTTRALVFGVLTEMMKQEALQPGFHGFTELVILKVLQAHKDQEKDVVRAAEACAATMAGVLPTEMVVRVLNPIVKTGDFPVNQAAIKMLTKLVEQQTPDSIDSHLGELMPGLLKAYHNVESSVRKAAVFCIVSIHQLVGEAVLQPHLDCLNGSKMKLLSLYIKRAQVANIESSSLLSAVSEVFGLNYVLDILGLAEVIAKSRAPGEVSKEVVLEKIEAAAEVVEEDVPKKVEENVHEKVEAVVEARRSPRLSRKSSAL